MKFRNENTKNNKSPYPHCTSVLYKNFQRPFQFSLFAGLGAKHHQHRLLAEGICKWAIALNIRTPQWTTLDIHNGLKDKIRLD